MSNSIRSSSASSRRSRSSASAKEEFRTPLLDLGFDESDEFVKPSRSRITDRSTAQSTQPVRETDMFADVPLDVPDEITFAQPSPSPRRLSENSDDMEEVDLLSADLNSNREFGRKPRTPRAGSSILSSLSAGWRDRWNRPRHEATSGFSASDVLLDAGERSFEMRARTKESSSTSQSPSNLNPSFVLVDIPIETTDTLPSFAIRYHVTTAELKRLNNLFHDQDFYSRQSLKVPIHKYGILAERYLPSSSAYDNLPSTSILVDLDSPPPFPPESAPDEEVTHQVNLRPQSIEAKLFLQNMDRDLTRLTQLAMQRKPMSPVASDPDLQGARMRVEPLDGLGCDGADLGIPVKVMILMALILTVVLPGAFLIYKLYCVHHPENCPDGMTVPVHNYTDPH